MQATIRKTNRQIEVISDPAQVAAAEEGDLKIGEKKVLITKGGCTASVTGEVYLAFADPRSGLGDGGSKATRSNS